MTVPMLDRLRAGLRSPCCRDTLDDRWRCGTCRAGFELIDGRPVLVDFATSVLAESTVRDRRAASPVRRRSRFRRIRRLAAHHNPVIRAQLEKMLAELGSDTRVLVVGGGRIAPGSEVLYDRTDVVGTDIYVSGSVQVVADAHRLPFADEFFDAVLVTAVLEHVLSPQEVVDEIWRVLRPGGQVYAETAFLQGVHEGAYDFTRFTPSGHRWLFRGFDEVAAGPIGGPFLALNWALETAVVALTRSRLLGVVARVVFRPLGALDRVVPAGTCADSAVAVFFRGRRRAENVTPREVIAGYSGAQ